MCAPCPPSASVYRAFSRSARPHSSAAMRAVNSSLVARNTFVRKHCSSVRQASSLAERGSQRADALRRDDRNQPRLARQRERAFVAGRVGFADGRKGVVLVGDEQQVAPRRASDCAAIFGMRCRTARWKSSFSITPSPRASAGFMRDREIQARARGRFRADPRAAAAAAARPVSAGVMYAARGGQNARYTAGFSSKSDRNTTMPSTMDALTVDRAASTCCRTSGGSPRAGGGGRRKSRRSRCARRTECRGRRGTLRAPRRTDGRRACRRAAPTASTAPAASCPGSRSRPIAMTSGGLSNCAFSARMFLSISSSSMM